MENKKNIIIIGGGAAGMMAAISALLHNPNVILIEKNGSLGRKLMLTGGGRCNFTNLTDINQYSEHFFHGGKFLRDVFKEFSNQDTIQFFKKNGVNSKIEDNNCVFPSSGHAEDILEAFKRQIKQSKINLLLEQRLIKIIVGNGEIKGIKLDNNKILDCSALILASGGISYPHTGSNGEGLKIAAELGHTISDLGPGLVSLVASQKFIPNLQGLSIKDAKLSFKSGNKKLKSKKGDFLFTNNGVSGPLTLSASSIISEWLAKSEKVKLTIDFYPDSEKEILLEQLTKKFTRNPKRNINNLLGDIMIHRLAQTIISINNIKPTKKAGYITKTEILAITESLKRLQLDITGTGPLEKAMITQGGVSLKQVYPKTMESRIVKGLYFAGEILDVDGDCGGFNLQSAFSTGYSAGKYAALSIG